MLNITELFKKDIRVSPHIMRILDTGVIVAMITIALAGIALLVAASSLVQSASATDVMNTTTQRAVGSSNNNSNVTLGNLVYVAHGIEETANPVNDTYIVISYVDSITLMPPNATTDVVINATERGNLTSNIQPNGLSVDQGQGLITTEGGGGGQQETATVTFASLGRSDPEGTTGSSTGAAFFSTNSTGQLAFLNNMVGIAQVEFSPEESTVRIWEWKGGSLAPENGSGGGAATTGNQTTTPES
jgi:hypothetical protein